MIAEAMSSLHWPTKLSPRERAANALSSMGRLVSTMETTNDYWRSALERPA